MLRAAGAGVLVAAGLASTGCANSYRLNPTPEMATLSNTEAEVYNRTTVTFDTNLRALWEDGARFMLVDRPSLLMRPRLPH
jgi:hypothetical protein